MGSVSDGWMVMNVLLFCQRVTDADLRALVSDEVFQAEPVWKLGDIQVN